MQILHTLDDIPSPCTSLTVGNFDALHLGHQALLNRMEGRKCLLTFSNHPSTILSTSPKLPVLSLAHKLHLLERYGVDTVILLPFTRELSQMGAEPFLKMMHDRLSFSSLFLGHDARIGYRREGDPPLLQKIADELSFSLTYLPPVLHDEKPISTSRIRTLLQQGCDVTSLLGRPYSIIGTVQRGESRGKKIGFPTLNIDVKGLALPPLGVWKTTLLWNGQTFPAVANLGLAPTVRQSVTPLLEVHIPGFNRELYDQTVEVAFGAYLRPERKFLSLEELKQQIKRDIESLL